MAKRRRQDSLRASWLARNSSNGIGLVLVQRPPGERKSGMPHSVEMPAPVNGTIVAEASTSARSRSIPVLKSAAIIYGSLTLTRPPKRLAMRYLHTMLRVRNLDAALDFYCNKLGLKEVRRRVDEKNKFTLVVLAGSADGDLVAQ